MGSRTPSALRGVWAACSVLGLLAAGTALLHRPATRFAVVALNPRPPADLAPETWKPSRCGVVSSDPSSVVLTADESCRNPSASRRFPVHPGFTHMRVEAHTAFDPGAAGSTRRVLPLLSVAALDVDGRALSRANSQPLRTVARPIRASVDQVVPIPRGATAIRLAVLTRGARGTLTLDRLKMTGLREAPWFGPVRIAVASAWAVAVLWWGALVLRSCARVRLRPLVAVVGLLILLGTLAPSLHLGQLGRRAAPSTERAAAGAKPAGESAKEERGLLHDGLDRLIGSEWSRGLLRNLWHAVAFAVFTSALLAAAPAGGTLHAAVVVATFAVATEALQLVTPHRMPELADIVSDLFGTAIILGVVVVAGALRRLARRF